MANFTDASVLPYLTQHTPYVQQFPIDAAVTVGRFKQAQYDQGLQRIQTDVEKVAGMDVARPVDRQYLESKLNSLKGNLRMAAAADFSNYQLTNSVGGMISGVAKDPNIRNAVASTQLYRKEVSNLESARKSGKSSAQNDAYFQQQVNSWISNPDVKASFNGRYVEYTDVGAKLRTLVKDIPEIESIADIPFIRDSSGNIVRDANGKPSIDSAMLRSSVKGKSAQKILDNFMSSLDENDIRQLGIDGWYHYRGATKDSFKRDIANTYAKDKQRIQDRTIDLSVELKNNPNLTSKEKSQIEAEINNYNRVLSSGEYESRMQRDLGEIDNIEDFESYKQKLYTQKFIGNLADAMSYESKKTTFETNPYKQVELQMANINLQYAKLRQDEDQFRLRYNLDLQKHGFELAKEQNKSMGGLGAPISKPLSTDMAKFNMQSFSQEIEGLNLEMKEFRNKKAELIFGDEIYDKATGKRKEDWEVEQMFRKLYDEYNTSPSSKIEPEQRRAIETYRAMDMDFHSKANAYVQVGEDSKKFDTQLKQELRNQPPLEVKEWNDQYGGYNVYNVSPEDMVAVLNTKNRFTETGASPGTGAPGYFNFDKESFINQYKGSSLEKVARVVAGEDQKGVASSAIRSYANKIQAQYGPKVKELASQKEKFQADELQKRMPEYFSAISAVNMEDKAMQFRVDAAIGEISNIATGLGLDVDNNKSFDASTIAAWRSEKGDAAKAKVDYLIEKKGDGSGALILQRGGEEQIIPMNQSQFNNFFPEVANTHPLQSELATASYSKNKTTNAAGIKGKASGAISAKFLASDLPTGITGGPLANIVKFDIEAADSNVGDSSDEFLIRMYAFDRKTGEWKQDLLNYDYIRADQIMDKLRMVSPAVVADLLKKE